MGTSIGDVFIALGFDVDDSKLKTFSDNIDGLQKDMLKLSGVAAGTVYGIERFMRGSIDSATALENLKDATGESTTEVLRWMTAANATNTALSFDAVRESIMGVNDALSAGMLGANRNIFMLLGIDWVGKDGQLKKGTEFLNEIRANWDNIVKRYQPFGGIQKLMSDLSTIGVNKGMQQAFMLSDEQFNAMANNYEITEKTILANEKLGQNITELEQKFKSLKDNLVGEYAPSVMKALDGVVPYAQNVEKGFEKVKTAAIALGTVSGLLLLAFNPLLLAATAIGTIIAGLEFIGNEKTWSKFLLWNSDAKFRKNDENNPFNDNGIISPWEKTNLKDRSFYQSEADRILNQNNTNNFTIYGATDPQAISNAISQRLDTEKRNTWTQLNNGVLK